MIRGMEWKTTLSTKTPSNYDSKCGVSKIEKYKSSIPFSAFAIFATL